MWDGEHSVQPVTPLTYYKVQIKYEAHAKASSAATTISQSRLARYGAVRRCHNVTNNLSGHPHHVPFLPDARRGPRCAFLATGGVEADQYCDQHTRGAIPP